MVKDSNFIRNLEDYMNKIKPEASYFLKWMVKEHSDLLWIFKATIRCQCLQNHYSSEVQKLSFIL